MKRITKARHGSGGGAKAGNVNGLAVAKLPGAINMGFADGHAETVPFRNLWNYYWHKEWTPSTVPNNLTAN